jgi:hypothetical protein
MDDEPQYATWGQVIRFVLGVFAFSVAVACLMHGFAELIAWAFG